MTTSGKYNKVRLILTLFIAFVFIQSLFFKFSDAPETQHIFSVLNEWAAGYGFDGLFIVPGIFNAYVIGTVELIASTALLIGLFAKKPILHMLGTLLAVGVMTGAITFHLFTPLGVEVQGDGGTLFIMACGVWLSAAFMLSRHITTLRRQVTGG